TGGATKGKRRKCYAGRLCHRVSPPGMRLASFCSVANAVRVASPCGGWMALRDQYRVLVVEDDPDIRRILQLFLTERDFAVTTAETATVALELLAQAPVDLILSDVRMPGMSGIELLHHIRERDPDVQLVLMTAYSSVKDAVEAIQAGATDYIEKPIDFRRLERILDVVFERRRLTHENR